MAESLVLLAVAVVIFRGFGVEGYLISTGSMAPTLLGYHHRVHCPECSFLFARGARISEEEESGETVRADFDSDQQSFYSTRCPNCGYSGISTETLPRTEGDQLLVHKHAFEFRDPRRWEVVVFRNPGDPQQAYVKRVIGLPGETVRISDGELFVDGKLMRKPYSTLRGMRIPFSEYSSQTDVVDHDVQPCWVKLSKNSAWNLEPDALRICAADQNRDAEMSWIGYRHWIPSGGMHVTRVKLAHWPPRLARLDTTAEPLQYSNGELKTVGVFTDVERRTWLARTDDPQFHRAMNELCERSHVAPITDQYGYNSGDTPGNLIHDFSISLTLSEIRGGGRFEIELSDGEQIFSAVFKFADRTVEVLRNGDPVPVRSCVLTDAMLRQAVTIDFSLIDQQVVLALNGREVVEAFPYERRAMAVPMSRPVRFGAAGMDVVVTGLQLFRDVYYTHGPAAEGTDYRTGKGEYFVLGDNSPVSVDSRYWSSPAVPRSALIGKPLVVHLPSKSQRFNWNGDAHDLRLPDFSRVRIVR